MALNEERNLNKKQGKRQRSFGKKNGNGNGHGKNGNGNGIDTWKGSYTTPWCLKHKYVVHAAKVFRRCLTVGQNGTICKSFFMANKHGKLFNPRQFYTPYFQGDRIL
ncbi:TPA: hypothetical protein DEW47_02370 [Patescibacteria group bacterium]|nr:hypothetical protein [Patescibacteria group bacterium]HCI04803.1 hypothetical protein [Patescibacteria group bacterium]